MRAANYAIGQAQETKTAAQETVVTTWPTRTKPSESATR